MLTAPTTAIVSAHVANELDDFACAVDCGTGALDDDDFATSASFAKSSVGCANCGDPPAATASKSSIKSLAF